MSGAADSWSDAFDIVPEAMLLVGESGDIVRLNDRARELLPGAGAGERLPDWLADGEAGFETAISLLRRSSGNLPLRLTLGGKDEPERRVRVVGRRLRNAEAGLHFVLRVPAEERNTFAALSKKVAELGREVRERRVAQKTAEDALETNRVLTRELYHRVNNNLQLQISLLRRAARDPSQPGMHDFVSRAIGRLRAMSAGLDLTYRSGAGALVDISDLLSLLVSQFVENHAADGQISLELETAFFIPEVQVTPLALIVNEAVTNAFGNAPDREAQSIALRCWKDGETALLDIRESSAGAAGLMMEQSDAEAALIDILARQAAVDVERVHAEAAALRLKFKAL